MIALTLLVASALAACPTSQCGNITAPLCALRTNSTQLLISESGCASGFYCSMSSYISWGSGTASNFSCSAVSNLTGVVGIEWTYAPCVAWRPGQDWMAGGTQLLCTKDADCLKADGTYDAGACVCVPRLDTSGVCAPDPCNLALFTPYWETCNSSSTLYDQSEYQYWAFAFENWAYLQSDMPCVGTFWETGEYQRLLDAYNSAGIVSVAAGVTVLLL